MPNNTARAHLSTFCYSIDLLKASTTSHAVFRISPGAKEPPVKKFQTPYFSLGLEKVVPRGQNWYLNYQSNGSTSGKSTKRS